MKLVFSTKYVKRASFLDLCRFAHDYGYAGIEIYDALYERKMHHDSILRSERVADAKRKLLNRGLSVSALTYPKAVDSNEASAEEILKYVELARSAAIERVIFRVDEATKMEVLNEKM